MELARWIPALLGVQPNPKSGACNSTGLASLRSYHSQPIYTPPLISSFDEVLILALLSDEIVMLLK